MGPASRVEVGPEVARSDLEVGDLNLSSKIRALFRNPKAADRCRLSVSGRFVESFQRRSFVLSVAERCSTWEEQIRAVFAADAMSTLLLCVSPLLLVFVSLSLREFSISNFSATFDLNFLWFLGQFSPLQLL